MAVYDGFPSIRLEGDEGKALALIPEAKVLLYKLQQFLQRGEVDTYSMSRRVGEDGYIYVRAVRGQYFIHVSVRPQEVDQTYETPEPPEVASDPSILSGMVTRGFLREIELPNGDLGKLLESFAPTSTTQRVHGLYPGYQSLPRLAVEPSDTSLMNTQSLEPVYSQYTKLRPSMYSGKMQQVVQVLMGFGHLSPGVIRTLRESVDSQQYAETVKTRGMQIRYDYKFHRTHGIVTAADERPWLVEVSMSRGVLAMPLPIFEGSDTPGFAAKFQAKGEHDVVEACVAVGGLPTGEGFPGDPVVLNRRIERGDILQLATPDDLAGFYDASPYSSILGWAFSPDGSEAHNTAYYYGDDGYAHGIWWQISLEIGATNQNWVPGENKLATGSAIAKQMGDGFLYTPSNLSPLHPMTYLPFKVHEPGLGGLVSLQMPAIGGGDAPKCDTVVHVCFINGEFHAVKFFRSSEEDRYNEVVDPRYPGECMYAGAWTIEERRGVRGFPTMMYTNVRDDRRVAQEFYQRTDIESVDLGHGPALISDQIMYPHMAWIRRQKYFRKTTDVLTQSGETIRSVVVVPEFAREAYYYAYGDAIESERTSKSRVYEALTDPNQAYTWRCLTGGMSTMPGVPSSASRICGGDCSSLAITNRRSHPERRVVYKFRNESACSDFADDGDWPAMCENMDNQPDSPNYPAPFSETSPAQRKETGMLRLYMTGIGGEKAMPFTFGDVWRWWSPSPHPETGEIHQIVACHNTLGSDAICYMTDFVGYGLRRYEGFFLVDVTANDPVPCFIGVYQP